MPASAFHSPRAARPSHLHVRVRGAAEPFGADPVNILRGVFDIAGLAVHAVLGVDLKSRTVLFMHDFIHAGGAVSLRGLSVVREVDGNRNARIAQREMARLIFFMVGIRQKD